MEPVSREKKTKHACYFKKWVEGRGGRMPFSEKAGVVKKKTASWYKKRLALSPKGCFTIACIDNTEMPPPYLNYSICIIVTAD